MIGPNSLITFEDSIAFGIGILVTLLGLYSLHNNRDLKQRKGSKPPWNGPATLYHTPSFMSSRAACAVAELGVDENFVIKPYNPYTPTKEEKEWYKKHVNHHGKIPGLVLDGSVMTESAAICLYLAEVYGDLRSEEGTELRFLNWIVSSVASLDHVLHILHRQLELMPEIDQNPAIIAQYMEMFSDFMRPLNDHLKLNDYICGKRFSIADIVVGYDVLWISYIKHGDLLKDYEHASNYLDRLKARKSFAAMGNDKDWLHTAQWSPKWQSSKQAN